MLDANRSLWEKANSSLAEMIELLESRDVEIWYANSRRRSLSLEVSSKDLVASVASLKAMSKKEFDTFARVDPSFKAFQRDWNSSLSRLEKDSRDMDKEAKKLAGLFKKKAASLYSSLNQESVSAKSGKIGSKASVYDLAAVKAINKIQDLRGRVYDVEFVLTEAAEDQTALSNVLPPRDADQKFLSLFRDAVDKIGDYIESMAKTRSTLLGILDKIEADYVQRMKTSRK